MNEYLEFLERKKHLIGDFGFEPTYFPDIAPARPFFSA